MENKGAFYESFGYENECSSVGMSLKIQNIASS
jgi:hypothetical protein